MSCGFPSPINLRELWFSYCSSREMPLLEPEVLQSGFGGDFFILAWRILGKANFSANVDGKSFPRIFRSFSRGVTPPPKTHAQNLRPNVSPFLSKFTYSNSIFFTPIFGLRGRPAFSREKKSIHHHRGSPEGLFSRSVARPRAHRAKPAMVYTIFLGKQGKRVYTTGLERRVYTIEPQTLKKKKGSPRWWCMIFLPCSQPNTEKKKAYTTATERKSFGQLFWPQR